MCVKAKSGAYPENCGGTCGYEEYYPDDEGREELDIDFINDEYVKKKYMIIKCLMNQQ